MPYQYTPSTKLLKELPEMEEPIKLDYRTRHTMSELDWSYRSKHEFEYQQHLASRKEYLVVGEIPSHWVEGYEVQENEFVKRYEIFDREWIVVVSSEYNDFPFVKRIVAIPLPVKVEQSKCAFIWTDELVEKFAKNLHSYLNQGHSIWSAIQRFKGKNKQYDGNFHKAVETVKENIIADIEHFEFPEKWALKCENEEEVYEFGKWLEETKGLKFHFVGDLNSYFHYPAHSTGHNILFHTWQHIQPSYTPITFTQWKQHYYPEKVEGKEDNSKPMPQLVVDFHKYFDDEFSGMTSREDYRLICKVESWLRAVIVDKPTQSEVEQTQEELWEQVQNKIIDDNYNNINFRNTTDTLTTQFIISKK